MSREEVNVAVPWDAALILHLRQPMETGESITLQSLLVGRK